MLLGSRNARRMGSARPGPRWPQKGGATGHQLMSIFGWETIKEAERYTRSANRHKLAGEAMHLIAEGLGERKKN